MLCMFALGGCASHDTSSPSTDAGDAMQGGAISNTEESGGTDNGVTEGNSMGTWVDGVVLVTFDEGTTSEDAVRALESFGGTVDSEALSKALASESPVVVQLPDGMPVGAGVDAARGIECVSAAQPNYLYQIQ